MSLVRLPTVRLSGQLNFDVEEIQSMTLLGSTVGGDGKITWECSREAGDGKQTNQNEGNFIGFLIFSQGAVLNPLCTERTVKCLWPLAFPECRLSFDMATRSR